MATPASTQTQARSEFFQVTTTLLCITILIWLVKYHWGRRKLYALSWKLPGPFGYPIVGSAFKLIGRTSESLDVGNEVIAEYSDLTRGWLGPKFGLLISRPDLFEIILNSPHCLEKDSLYGFLNKALGTGLFTAPVNKWKKHRKLINPAFNQKLLDSFVGIFTEQAKIFLEVLDSKVGVENLDIFSLVADLTLDNLCDSTMGIQIKTQKNTSDLGHWIHTIMDIAYLRATNIFYQLDFIFNLTHHSKTMENAVENLHNFTNKVIREKRQSFQDKQEKLRSGEEIDETSTSKRKSFLELLLEQSQNGRVMTDGELREEVDTFTVAGTDTTAGTLCFCFTMLGMHQDVQQKLFEEVVDILGVDRDVTLEDLPHFKYMDRFIKETLRLFPIGPLIVRVCQADLDLGDCIVPPDCSLVLFFIGVHRSEKYWKNPLKFDPDRFLQEEVAKRHPYAYMPFSGGARNCIGYKYALMAIKTTLAMIIRKFVIKTEYKSVEDIRVTNNIVLRPTDGFKVSFEHRI